MVQLFVEMTAPPGQALEVLRAFESVRLPAQIARDCTRTQISVDSQDADVITYVEEWSSRESLERRVASNEFKGILLLMEVSARRPVLECRFVGDVRGLEYVSVVRNRADRASAPSRPESQEETPS
jgi:quinol monooxygenase YgiN